jgi:hypothetical protein
MRFYRLLVVAYLILFSSIFLQAEDASGRTGIILGRVVNAVTQEPLIGANVVVLDTNLGAAANSQGRFVIENVPVGTYNLRASVIGFSSSVKTDIIVTPVRPAEVLFMLSESSVQLDAVTVTADFFQKLPGAPLSTQSQSYEEIRRLPGGLEDVVRAISILPGVAQVQPGRNDLIVRGGAPSENLFIVENIEVPNINHFGTQGATGGPTSFINLDFVSGTTFSTGGFGVQYGDKLSSVLTIDLREGRKDRLGGKATISATQFGLNLEGPIHDNGSYLFSARRSYLDFIFRTAGFGFVPEYWDFLAKADYRPDTKNRISVLGIGALNKVRIFNDTEEQRYDNSRILYSNQNQFIGGVSWQRLFSSGYTTVTAGQTYFEYKYLQNDTELQPVFRNDSHEIESALRADLVLRLTDHSEISSGVQGKVAYFSSDIFLTSFESNFDDVSAIDAVLDTTGFKAAAYAQYTYHFGRLNLSLGARIDYFDLIRDNIAFSPRLSGSYAVGRSTNLNASIGRYYQAPSYIWLAANSQNRNLSYIGADQIVIGIEHLLRNDIKVSIESYLKRYFNYPASVTRPYLVLANTGAGYGGADEGFASFGLDPLVGEGKGLARGVEFFAQKKLSEIPLYGTVSISYNESEFKGLDGIKRSNSYDQRWIFNIGGGYIHNDRWEFGTKFRYATGRPYTPFNADGTQDPLFYNTARVPANHSLDFRVDRRWIFDKLVLITYIDIQNIYNRKAQDVPRYNRRTGEFDRESSIGILPSIGISLEF